MTPCSRRCKIKWNFGVTCISVCSHSVLLVPTLFEEKVGIMYYRPSVRLSICLSCSETPPTVLELGPSNFGIWLVCELGCARRSRNVDPPPLTLGVESKVKYRNITITKSFFSLCTQSLVHGYFVHSHVHKGLIILNHPPPPHPAALTLGWGQISKQLQ